MAPSSLPRLVGGAGIVVALLGAPTPAHANGRYPWSQQVVIDPSDARHLWLRTTYGVLTSPDAGGAWHWICEGAVGYDPAEDPMMAAFGDGTAVAAASTGLFATRDLGCSWTQSADIGNQFVRDVAAEGDGSGMLALTVTVEANGDEAVVVWSSEDASRSWKALGPPISLDVAPMTLDPAPSDPQRVYVSGAIRLGAATDAGLGGMAGDASVASSPDGGTATANPGVLLRSRDGGRTWERRRIPGTSVYDQPFIAAVHPTNPDIVYVRVQGQWSGVGAVQSWLLYTDDAGDTWKELFRGPADMLGFALGADGRTVLVGMGDTHDAQRPVDRTALGIHRATAPSFSFARVFTGHVGCLAYAGQTLYVCGNHDGEGFELGASTDDGETVTKVLDYGDVRGPLECPKATPETTLCAPAWKYACGAIASCPPATDAGASRPAAAAGARGSRGCDCDAPRPTPGPSTPQLGTARLEMLPDWALGLAVTSWVAARIDRRRRRRRRRHS